MLEIEISHWSLAKAHFKSNKQSQKFIPNLNSPYCFIQTEEGGIYAMARKKSRAENLITQGDFGIIVKVQNEEKEEFACKISLPKAQTNEKEYQILEQIAGETLTKILEDVRRQKRPPLFTLEKDIIALKLTLALLNFHRQRIIHGNISNQAVMVSLENDVQVSLLDFGSTLPLPRGATSIQCVQDIKPGNYEAPEVISDHLYSFASDYYALGVVFMGLNRPKWAKKLMNPRPNLRANAHEILFDIWLKIKNENAALPKIHTELIDNVENMLMEYFADRLKQGVYLNYLIQNNLTELFDDQLISLLALNLCMSYFEAFKENAKKTKIYNKDNFIVQIVDKDLRITFDATNTKLDTTIAPPEYYDNQHSDRSGVYALARILESLGIECAGALKSDYRARPDIITFMNELYLIAQKKIAECDDDTDLQNIFSYLAQQKPPILTLISGSDNDEADDNVTDKIGAPENSKGKGKKYRQPQSTEEDDSQLMFQMDDLEDNLEACALAAPAKNLLTQYHAQPLDSNLRPLTNERAFKNARDTDENFFRPVKLNG